MPDHANRARDQLANERTFLAWVRTGVAVVVFGFAIGRFSIAIRQFTLLQARELRTSGLSVWFGLLAIAAGVVLTLAGLLRYRQTREQLDQRNIRAGRICHQPGSDADSDLRTGTGRLSPLYRNGAALNHGQ